MVMFGCCLDGMVTVTGYYRVYTMIHVVTVGGCLDAPWCTTRVTTNILQPRSNALWPSATSIQKQRHFGCVQICSFAVLNLWNTLLSRVWVGKEGANAIGGLSGSIRYEKSAAATDCVLCSDLFAAECMLALVVACASDISDHKIEC